MPEKIDYQIPEECRACPLQCVIATRFEEEASHIADLVEAVETVEYKEGNYCESFDQKISKANDIDQEHARRATLSIRNVIGELLHAEMREAMNKDAERLNELKEFRDELKSTCKGPKYLKHESEGGDSFHLIACTSVKAYTGNRTKEVLGMEGVMTVIDATDAP